MTAKVLLAASVVLNLALSVALVRDRSSGETAHRAQLSAPQHSPTLELVFAPSAVAAQSETNTRPFWKNVESADYIQYVKNLRAAGCPEKTIRDIVIADVNALVNGMFAERIENLTNSIQYWTEENSLGGLIKLEQAATQEKKRILTQIFGSSEADAAFTFPLEFSDLGLLFLPPEKRDSVKQVLAHFEFRRIQELGDGAITGERMRKLQALDQERDAYLQKLLTPEDKFEFDVRNSTFAESARNDLRAFEPTESEFREIFKLRQEVKNLFASDGALREDHQSIISDYNDKLRSVLGDDRFSEYSQAYETSYRKLYDIANSALSRNEITELYQEITSSIDDAKQSLGLLPENERPERVTAAVGQVKTIVAERLGPEAADLYTRQVSWHSRLHQKQN